MVMTGKISHRNTAVTNTEQNDAELPKTVIWYNWSSLSETEIYWDPLMCTPYD